MKNIFLGFFFILWVQIIYSQQVLWQTCVGGSMADHANGFEIARDGCYIIVGSTRSTDVPELKKTSPDADVFVIKMNSKGRVLWKKTFGGGLTDEAYDVRSTRDGGFIVVGSTDSPNLTKGNKDFYVIRLDALGTLLWQKTYGGTGNEIAKSVEVLEDGGCVVSGETSSKDGMIKQPKGGIDGWVIRLSPKGDLIWEKTIGGRNNDQLYYSVKCMTSSGTFDKSILLTGSTESTDGDFQLNKGKSDALVCKMDLEGNTIWTRTFGGNNIDIAYGITTSYDGKIVVVGTTSSTTGSIRTEHNASNDVFIIHIDNDGNLVWSKAYGGNADDGAYHISPTFEKNFVIAATSNSKDGSLLENKGGNDAWCFMIDLEGKILWQKVMGGTGNDQFLSAKEVPSGDFVAIGTTPSKDGDLNGIGRSGATDYWAVCLKKPIDNGVRSITPTTIQGYIRNAETKKFIEAEVRVVKNEKLQKISSDKSDSTYGIYQVFLPDTDQTSIGVFADGFLFYGKNITISNEDRYSEIRLDIELKPIKKDAILDLYNIHFEIGSHKLTNDSKPELERIVEFLNQNPKVFIQVNGHTDGTGPQATKQRLSELRAESVMRYLIDRGIAAGRLTYKGFGMTKPIADESTEEGRQKNRRVEIQIIKF